MVGLCSKLLKNRLKTSHSSQNLEQFGVKYRSSYAKELHMSWKKGEEISNCTVPIFKNYFKKIWRKNSYVHKTHPVFAKWSNFSDIPKKKFKKG